MMDELRTLFMQYHILKHLSITQTTKIFLAFEINTKKTVLMRIIKNTLTKNEVFDILTLLKHKALPRILFNKKIEGYRIVIEECVDNCHASVCNDNSVSICNDNSVSICNDNSVSVNDGNSNMVNSSNNITSNKSINDNTSPFTQIMETIKFLQMHKIRISEIHPRNITIDNQGNVKMKEIDWMYFDESVDEEYEKKQRDSLMKVIGDDNCKCDDQSNLCKNDNSKTNNKNSTTPVYIIDPLIIDCINSYHFPWFNPQHINNPSKREFHLFRLAKEYILNRNNTASHSTSLASHSTSLDRFQRIERRSEILTGMVEYKTECCLMSILDIVSIFNNSTVMKYCNDHKAHLSISTVDTGDISIEESSGLEQCISKALKVIPFYYKEGKAYIKNPTIGLKIYVKKKEGRIEFIKERGRERDFVELVSELVDSM